MKEGDRITFIDENKDYDSFKPIEDERDDLLNKLGI